MISNSTKPLTFKFVGAGAETFLELTNGTEQTLKSIEILTIFLKDEETPGGGPSQAHIRFDPVQSIQPKAKVAVTHRTWINGKPADTSRDQIQRLQSTQGTRNPYVLDISWLDSEGKTRYQRIPVGH